MFTIILSENYSDNIDGVKLFEYCNSISKDIKIAYHSNRLELYVDNQKDAVEKILKLVDHLDMLQKSWESINF